MPLPWKKTKPNRISRIVADLQTPSRVVETGFPTSVVDLFVKNRDRIKRHALKKTKHKHSPLHVSESAAPPPTPSLSPNNSPRLPAHEAVALVAATVDHLQHDSTPPRREFHVHKSATPNANANANSNSTVFVVAGKMFLAVVPVLSIKKLALGITLSALLLFLLEILGQFAARFFNSSSTRNRYFWTTAAERRRDRLIDREEEEGFPRINSGSNNEIQMVESNCSDYEQSGSGGAGEKGLGGCWDLEMEMEEEGKLEMGKSERSRSSKLKAKIIKKLIPKKLRSGKRTKRNKNEKKKMKEEAGITIMENEQGTESSSEEEDQEEHEVWEVQQQMWEPEEEEIGPSAAMGKEKEEEEEDEERKKKNLECRFVILMILLGLCEGRFQALVLTVSGSFMIKFIKFLYQKWKFG